MFKKKTLLPLLSACLLSLLSVGCDKTVSGQLDEDVEKAPTPTYAYKITIPVPKNKYDYLGIEEVVYYANFYYATETTFEVGMGDKRIVFYNPTYVIIEKQN
jgi:hypothetical protein